MMRLHLLTAFAGLSLVASSQARPPHRQALAQYFGPLLDKKLVDCRTCHVPDSKEGKEDEERPHNPFGARLAAVKKELTKAGKTTTIEARLDAILREDTDGDGSDNLTELLTGHNPGEKADAPAAKDLAEIKTLLSQFDKHRRAYPWRPFETVRRPALPPVKNAAWVRNPIDAFIAAEHESLGLKPRPEAPRHVLLRRLHLDLIGLPPSAEELKAFLDDSSPDAYEKAVDRLLASPRHGERWGRHWMDVWRYSDWAGYGAQVRDSQPHIWRWRDWIVEAINTDKGYDRMILEMLAGDELAPTDEKALAGTGFLVRNFKLLSREAWMQDVVEHTSMAFLGVTLGCARCHDHMYDPIKQEDYYRFRAVFEPHNVRTDRLPGQPDIKKDGLARAFDKDIAVPTYLFLRGDDRTPDKSKVMTPGVPEILGGFYKVEPIKLPLDAYRPEKRAFVIEEAVQASAKKIEKARADVAATEKTATPQDREVTKAALEHAEASHDALLKSLAVEKAAAAGTDATELARQAGIATRKSAVADFQHRVLVARIALENLDAKDAKRALMQKTLADVEKGLKKAQDDLKLPPAAYVAPKAATGPYPSTSTGRRLALARWIADQDNPLTARVAVNHIWLRHFGQAIVPSVFDFGRNGRWPTHPALLDWLAAEFTQPTVRPAAKAWSMKHLHRLIVTSSTYRQASTPDEANFKIDRDNKHLWRFAPRRLEAEAVRDSIFHVAGKLDLKMGGADIDYPLGLTVARRSLYFRHAAEKQMEFLLLFDAAAVNECYERKHSIVPQQALALFNSELALKHSRILARNLAKKTGADASAFVVAAFEQMLSRRPTDEERSECVSFVEDQTKRLREAKTSELAGGAEGAFPSPDPALRARENLVHVLMNHHEFVTIR